MNLKELITLLKEKQIKVLFNKKDGTLREMLCTLSEETIGTVQQAKAVRKRNPDVLPVWDIENRAWRSFRLDSIIKVLDGENEYAYRG